MADQFITFESDLTVMGDSIACIGDLHLDSQAPGSRIDDYPETTLEKLRSLRRMCISNGHVVLLLTGDIFHRKPGSVLPTQYLNKIIFEFAEFKRQGITVCSCVGNHDISFDSLDTLVKGPLGALILAGVVSIPRNLTIQTSTNYEVTVRFAHFPEQIPSACGNKREVKALVAHRFYNYSFDTSSLNESILEELGYHIVILGHDHQSYEPEIVGRSILLRPGSMTRGTSHGYNIYRNEISVDSIQFHFEAGKPRLIPVRNYLEGVCPAEQVFSSAVMNKDESTNASEMLTELSSQVDEFLSFIGQISGNRSVYTVIDGLKVQTDVKARLEHYLVQRGIYRQKETI